MENIYKTLSREPISGDEMKILADMELENGNQKDAVNLYRLAIARGASCELYQSLARAAFPGPSYQDHLACLHKVIQPSLYLEIGIFEGKTLSLAGQKTRAIGIDPAPRPGANRKYDAETQIFQLESDIFFEKKPESSFLKNNKIDVAFIDGLHKFGQVLRDFINVEIYCHSKSIIILHDTLPVAAYIASRKRRSGFWCGDVWPIVSCLRRYRPELIVKTVPTFPSGLTLVYNLDPQSRVLFEKFEEAESVFSLEDPSEKSDGPWLNGENGSDLLPNDPAEVIKAVNQWLISS